MEEVKLIYKFKKMEYAIQVHKQITETLSEKFKEQYISGEMKVEMDFDNNAVVMTAHGNDLCEGFLDGIQNKMASVSRLALKVAGLKTELYIDGKKERLI